MKKALIPILLLLWLLPLSAQDTTGMQAEPPVTIPQNATPQQLFAAGNKLYAANSYEEAIRAYEKILDEGFESEQLYYNLGNAYFKDGQLARAILNYERAKQLAPGDADIAYNLKLANLRISDKVEAAPELFLIRWWKNTVAHVSASTWAYVAVGLLWLALLLGILFIFSAGFLRRFSFFTGLMLMLLSVGTVLLAVNQHQHQMNTPEGIILAKNAYVKSSPDAQSTDLFILHEGLKVQLLEETDEWREIRLTDGKIGWLKKEQIEAI